MCPSVTEKITMGPSFEKHDSLLHLEQYQPSTPSVNQSPGTKSVWGGQICTSEARKKFQQLRAKDLSKSAKLAVVADQLGKLFL
jgi:hypothetical protein